jgi:hypothetical protein
VVEFAPGRLFVPPNPFGDARAGGVAEGALWFLQFDYLITSVAYVIWGVAVRYASPVIQVGGGENEGEGFGFGALVTVLGKCVALGPMAAVVTLLWDRDEVVFARDAEVDANAVAKKSI